MTKLSIHWFRRDLRLEDNHALSLALDSGQEVLPIFIFDSHIIEDLPKDDARLSFLHAQLEKLKSQIKDLGGDLLILQGTPEDIWDELGKTYPIGDIFVNEDYEPYALDRDHVIKAWAEKQDIRFHLVKDHVVFAKDEVMKDDGKPYTVFTPYKNKYRSLLTAEHLPKYEAKGSWHKHQSHMPSLADLGFEQSSINLPEVRLDTIPTYNKTRNYPAQTGTTHLGPHLRFGTVSVRALFRKFFNQNDTFINELIWREFFIQILFHFPHVVHQSFRIKYDNIPWRNEPEEFERWCQGKTGYPMVDAGMRELNATGYMHNRVRMVVASFLCKHLLIDWRWGEGYFAVKLLDYELASNNGNWQWAAGTGCDAAPYFRVFNPYSQQARFDPKEEYIRKWIPEIDTEDYPAPMVDHPFARQRALDTYKDALDSAT